MTKKSILSVLLTAMFILGGLPVYAQNDYANAVIYEEAEVLKSLDIYAVSGEEEFMPYENISRGEFYGMAMNILLDNAVDDISDTKKVKTALENLEGAVMSEAVLGENISCGEAVTYFLNRMGYKNELEKAANVQSAYMNKAAAVGMTENIKSTYSKKLDTITAIRLIYNALYVEFPEYELDGKVYKMKDEAMTLLKKYRHIYELDGVVDRNGLTSIYAADGLRENKLSIEGTIYEAKVDYSDMLGYRAEGLVKIESDGSGKILWLKKHKKNSEITVDTENIVSVGNNFSQFRYDEQYNNKYREKTAKLSENVKIIYNGIFCGSFTEEDFKPKIGGVKLVDNNNDGKYDVVFISSAEVMAVSGSSKFQNAVNGIYTYDGALTSLCFDDYEDYSIVMNGESIKTSDIMKYDIIRFYRSKDLKSYVTAEVSRNKVTGTLTSVTESSVTVDGAEYTVSEEYYTAVSKKDSSAQQITSGNVYTVYLDAENEAVLFDIDGDMYAKYGYMTRLAYTDDGEDIQLKIFNMDEKWETLKLAKKIRIQDIAYTAAKAYTVLAPGGVFEPQLIMYKKNSQGEIRMIETAILQDEFNEKRLTTSGKQTMMFSRPGCCFGNNRIMLMNSTKVLVLPVDKDDEDAYRLTDHNYFDDNTPYSFIAYRRDNFNVPEIITIEEVSSMQQRRTLSGELCVVLSSGKAVSPDDEVCDSLTVMTKSYDSLTLFADRDGLFDTIRNGDIISVRYSRDARVTDCNLYYSAKDGKKYLKADNLNGSSAPISGEITELSDSRNMYRVWCGSEYMALRAPSESYPVIFYDMQSNTARKGTFAEVQQGDFAFIRYAWYTTNGIVVIKH